MNTNRHKICVIGLGNTLMQDDGVGVITVKAVKERYRFEPQIDLLDGGTAGLDLLPVIEGYQRVLFVDAVDAGEEPGSILIIKGDEIASFMRAQKSAHHVGLADLLYAARISGCLPPEICLVGIQPESIDVGLELTDVLQSRLEMFVTAVLERLRHWDVKFNVI
jgi:hydrogenase maturation protease